MTQYTVQRGVVVSNGVHRAYPGDTIELDDHEGRRLVRAGVLVDPNMKMVPIDKYNGTHLLLRR